MKIINNLQNNSNHKSILIANLEDAEEVVFVSAYFKNRGLKLIESSLTNFLSNGKIAKFYLGINDDNAEPIAIENLRKILNAQSRIILCVPEKHLFHPKMYIFKKGNNVKIIIGSANFTKNGLELNDEVSLYIETETNSELYKEFEEYIKKLDEKYGQNNFDDVFNKYKDDLKEYQAQKAEFENTHVVKKFRFKFNPNAGQTSIYSYSLEEFLKIYEQNEKSDFPNRQKDYETAKTFLEELASNDDIGNERLKALIGGLIGSAGYTKLWKSGSIVRQGTKIYNNIDGFRNLIKYIKTELDKQDIGGIFHRIKNKKTELKLDGVGVNILTEILMTYNPGKFANLNGNPLRVLRELEPSKYKKAPNNYKSNDYEDYVKNLSQLKEKLKLSSFLELDSFFNANYWILEENEL